MCSSTPIPTLRDNGYVLIESVLDGDTIATLIETLARAENEPPQQG